MRWLVGAWRIVRAIVHLLHGIFIIRIRFGALDERERMLRVQWWSAKLLRLLGVTLVAEGTPRAGAKLVVSNHVSWLDIVAINAVVPSRFVSKAEVRHWPLVGGLVSGAGTLYIERERRRDAMRVVHQMAQALQAGGTLAVFPEGTTSDGNALLPFHANLLQAAIATETPVQPVVLRFSDAMRPVSPAAAYVGETTLLQSVAMIVGARGLRAHVQVLSAHATAHADRRALAAHLRELMAACLGAR
jgi:1-acyl-sn-glycerol-3-phosphate acyltransferase